MRKTNIVQGEDLILGFQAREGDDAPEPFRASRLGVRIRILPAEELRAVKDLWPGPCSTTLDDGRILVAELVSGWFSEENRLQEIPDRLRPHSLDEAEDPTWTADARELRDKLASFLESLPKVDWLQVTPGGNGTGTITVSYGEANLTLAIGRDPAS